MTNQNDPVPNVPPHFLDFQHPPGELHIDSVDDSTGDAQIVTCPGQENEVSAATAHTLIRLIAYFALAELCGRQLAPRHVDPEPSRSLPQRNFLWGQGLPELSMGVDLRFPTKAYSNSTHHLVFLALVFGLVLQCYNVVSVFMGRLLYSVLSAGNR